MYLLLNPSLYVVEYWNFIWVDLGTERRGPTSELRHALYAVASPVVSDQSLLWSGVLYHRVPPCNYRGNNLKLSLPVLKRTNGSTNVHTLYNVHSQCFPYHIVPYIVMYLTRIYSYVLCIHTYVNIYIYMYVYRYLHTLFLTQSHEITSQLI